MDEITAEFKTEAVQEEAKAIKDPVVEKPKRKPKGWIPVIVGMATLIGMAAIYYVLW